MGIQPGDVIISINDTPIDSMQSVRNEVLTGSPGEEVGVVVRRGGEDVALKGNYHEWPDHIPYSPIDQEADKNYRDMVQRRLDPNRGQAREGSFKSNGSIKLTMLPIWRCSVKRLRSFGEARVSATSEDFAGTKLLLVIS